MSAATQAPPAEHPAIGEIAARLREASDGGSPRRIVATGTWLDAGRPVRAEVERLDLSGVRGIVEYVPGDLTLTALAGTSLAELQEVTAENGQRLALDPYGTDAGTLGATIATASAGPLAGAYGTPRDNVLGVAFVTGSGTVVRGGGRVVKNVAGFDLVRLVTGAWGTLGVIVEASVRLRALPAVDETHAIAVDADSAHAMRTVAALRALPFTFDALELLDPRVAQQLGIGRGAGAILVRLSGTQELAGAMRAALSAAGETHEADPLSWIALRALEPVGCATIRLSHVPSRSADLWRAARGVAQAGYGWAHLAIGRNVARVTLPKQATDSNETFAARVTSALARAAAAFDGTWVAERLPAAAWSAPVLANPGAADGRARLAHGVRSAFDPARLLNPGIMGVEGGEA